MAAARPPVVGMPRSLIEAASEQGFIGCAARRPGKSQREPRFVAVFMLSRLLIHSSSRSAKGTGTGEGGSPSWRSTWSPSIVSHDSGARLGVEQDVDRGHSASQRQVVAGEEAPE